MITVFTFDNREMIASDVFSSNLKFRVEKDAIFVSYVPDSSPDYGRDDYSTECMIKIEPYSRFIITKKKDNSLFSYVDEDDNLVHSSCNVINFFKKETCDCLEHYQTFQNEENVSFVAEVLIASVMDDEIEILIFCYSSLAPDICIEDFWYKNLIEYRSDDSYYRYNFNKFKRRFYDGYTLTIDGAEIKNGKFVQRVDEKDDIPCDDYNTIGLEVSVNNREFIPICIKKYLGEHLIPATRNGDNDTLEISCSHGVIDTINLVNGECIINYIPHIDKYAEEIISVTRIPKRFSHVWKYKIKFVE